MPGLEITQKATPAKKKLFEDPDRPLIFIALAGLAVGMMLMIISLFGRGDLLSTEIISYDLASKSLDHMVDRLFLTSYSDAAERYHGGLLYHFLLHYWMVFGESELYLRSFSMIWGIATLFLLWIATGRLGNWIALVFTSLCATSPVLLYWFTSARSYSLFLFLAVISSLSLLTMLKKPGYAWVYAPSTVLLIYTHHFSIYLVASQVVFILICSITRLKKPLPYFPLLVCLLVIADSVIPLAEMFSSHAADRGFVSLRGISISNILDWPVEIMLFAGRILRHFEYMNFIGFDFLEKSAMTATGIFIITGFRAVFHKSKILFAFLMSVFLVPGLLHTLVFSLFFINVPGMRYYIYIAPAIFLAWALLVDSFRQGPGAGWRRRISLPILVVMIILNCSASIFSMKTLTPLRNAERTRMAEVLPDLQPWFMYNDWKEISVLIKKHSKENRVILLDQGKDYLYAKYYLNRERRIIGMLSADNPDKEDRIRHHLEVLTKKYDLVWCIREKKSGSHVVPITESAHLYNEISSISLKTRDISLWQSAKTGQPAHFIDIQDFYNANPGEHYEKEIFIENAGGTTFDIIARAADKPPFVCRMVVKTDEKIVSESHIGESFGILHSFHVNLDAGKQVITVEFEKP